jgi:hypothetical protein
MTGTWTGVKPSVFLRLSEPPHCSKRRTMFCAPSATAPIYTYIYYIYVLKGALCSAHPPPPLLRFDYMLCYIILYTYTYILYTLCIYYLHISYIYNIYYIYIYIHTYIHTCITHILYILHILHIYIYIHTYIHTCIYIYIIYIIYL